MTTEPHNLDTLGPYELAWLIALLAIIIAAACGVWTADDHRECRGAVIVQCHVSPESCVEYGEYVCE